MLSVVILRHNITRDNEEGYEAWPNEAEAAQIKKVKHCRKKSKYYFTSVQNIVFFEGGSTRINHYSPHARCI